MALDSFQYPSLERTKSQIRLLEILPQADSSLQYSLATFDLTTTPIPSYIALSYVWGDDEPTHTIVVNGQPFKVRNNLSDALPHLANLRPCGQKSDFQRNERYFWIDTICINQTNIEERNHQVAMMADIFSTASLTIAWLGPEDENLQTLTESCLENIARKEYFTRMWIIQEIVLSRDIWAMCGSGICTWNSLEMAWMEYFGLDHLAMLNGQISATRENIQALVRGEWGYDATGSFAPLNSVMASRYFRGGQALHLDEMVRLYWSRKCRDPRDRIYALLGLMPPQQLQSNPIPVDYSISLEDLFKLVRKYFHLHRAGLRTATFFRWGSLLGRSEFDYVRDLQMALGIDPVYRIECESQLIEEGFFRREDR